LLAAGVVDLIVFFLLHCWLLLSFRKTYNSTLRWSLRRIS